MGTLTRFEANRQAVKGAGERLARLEDALRKLFLVAIATAAMVTVTTGIIVYGAWKYWQVTSAMSQSMERLEKSRATPIARSIRP